MVSTGFPVQTAGETPRSGEVISKTMRHAEHPRAPAQERREE